VVGGKRAFCEIGLTKRSNGAILTPGVIMRLTEEDYVDKLFEK
jgi:hypothetical protein